MELNIINNEKEHQFEAKVENEIAYIYYSVKEDILQILSTQVPKNLEGKGIAAALTKFALEYARANNLLVQPICSYTVAYMKKHPEYNDLLKNKEK